VIPALILLNMLINEASALYQSLEAGDFNPGEWLDSINAAFPALQEIIERLDIDIERLKSDFSRIAVSITGFVGENALALGQGTLAWLVSFCIMLYLSFFMLRDGQQLSRLLARALPLGNRQQGLLFSKFTEVCRATIKGNLVVAIIQGSLGGLIFWILGIPGALLWGVIMIFLSLIPLVGAFLIWGPAALYLIATGLVIKGVTLALYGVIVISLVDNILRPMLVGRDTKLPDYMVLLSTLGGFALFGMVGFVLGPLIAVLFISFWGLFMEDYNQKEIILPVEAPESESV
jgi:predicted PurR-regulated permease PerM